MDINHIMASGLVSVVIPVYNSEKFLEECLDSILAQTYQNIEIIAVDDGSEDSSLNILKKYSDKIHIFSQKNQGLATALNLGTSPSSSNALTISFITCADVNFGNGLIEASGSSAAPV